MNDRPDGKPDELSPDGARCGLGCRQLSNSWCSTFFFFSSSRRHTRLQGDWSSDVCSSDLFDKRQLFNVLHSVSAGDEVREGVIRLQDYARRGVEARKLRVLVADDNATNREVIGRILDRGGHSATVVNDGEQALDAFEKERYDIVLLDRNMPELGGIEALRALRLMTRGRERLPVAILSADATAEARRECHEPGADAFLAKPIEAARLLDELQKLCAAKPEETRRPEPAPASRPASRTVAAAPTVINAATLADLDALGSSPGFLEELIGVVLR